MNRWRALTVFVTVIGAMMPITPTKAVRRNGCVPETLYATQTSLAIHFHSGSGFQCCYSNQLFYAFVLFVRKGLQSSIYRFLMLERCKRLVYGVVAALEHWIPISQGLTIDTIAIANNKTRTRFQTNFNLCFCLYLNRALCCQQMQSNEENEGICSLCIDIMSNRRASQK